MVTLTSDDVEEISSLRSMLETMAVRLAVVRATEEDFSRMEENIRAFEAATEPGDAGLLDLQFHEILVGLGPARSAPVVLADLALADSLRPRAG